MVDYLGDMGMRLRLMSESSGDGPQRYWRDGRSDNEIYIELAFVGPRSSGKDRRFGAYQLPHRFQTVNVDLLDNIEYYERAVVYDISNDKVAEEPLQMLKPMFKKYGRDYGEVVLAYNWEPEVVEKHRQMYQGEVLHGLPDIEELAGGVAEIEHGYVLLYKDNEEPIKIPFSVGFASAVLDNVIK